MRELFTVLILLSMVGCRPEFLSEQELKAYVLKPRHGLIKRVEKGNLTLELLYKPSDLVSFQEMEDINNENERQRIKAQYDSMSYFILRLSRAGQEIENAFAEDPIKFNKVINYLNEDIGKDIYLQGENGKIPPATIAYARNYGINDATQVLIVFQQQIHNLKSPIKIFYNDNFLGTGLNQFTFEPNDIVNTPSLKWN